MNSTFFTFPRHTKLTTINSIKMLNSIVVIVTLLNSFHTGSFDLIPGSVSRDKSIHFRHRRLSEELALFFH